MEKVNVIKPYKWLSQVALLDDVSREEVQIYLMDTSCGKVKTSGPTEARDFLSNTYEFNCKCNLFQYEELIPLGPMYDDTRSKLLEQARATVLEESHKILPRLLADQINANRVCCDGRPFFDTDHRATLRDGTSAVYSNDIVAAPGKDGLQKAVASMLKIPCENCLSSEGGSINGEMYRPIVLVSTFSEYNEFLKLRKQFDAPCDFEIVQVPELRNTSDPDAPRYWYMINGHYSSKKAFIVRAPGEPKITTVDREHTHDAIALSCTTYAGVAYGLPQLAIRCTF